MTLESKTLSYFVSACQHNHLSKAAKEIGVAVSTISMAMSGLEESIGSRLFDGGKTGHSPTREGLHLYQAAVRGLHAEHFCRTYIGDGHETDIEHLIVHMRFIFTLGRVAKAASRAIEQIQQQFPSTFIEPVWKLEPLSLPTKAKRLTSIQIGYEEMLDATGPSRLIANDDWILARELPLSTSTMTPLEELLDNPIIVPTLPAPLIDKARRVVRERGLSNVSFLDADPSVLSLIALEQPQASFLIPGSMLSMRLGLNRMRSVCVGSLLSSRILAIGEIDSPCGSVFLDRLIDELGEVEKNVTFRPEITLRQFGYFDAIYKSRSLSGAAKSVNIAQPALSNQLTKLETSVERRLFERNFDGLVPTAAGDRAKRAVEVVEGRFKGLSTTKVVIGKLALPTALGILAPHDLPPKMLEKLGGAIANWQRLHPSQPLTILEGSGERLQEWLLSDRISLAIVSNHHPRFARFKLTSSAGLSVVTNPKFRLIRTGDVSFEQLTSLPLMLPSMVSSTRQLIEQTARERGFVLKPRSEIDTPLLMASLLEKVPSVAIAASGSFYAQVRQGLLTEHAITDPELTRSLYLLFTTDRPLSALERELASAIRAVFPSDINSRVTAPAFTSSDSLSKSPIADLNKCCGLTAGV